ncbi:DUF188 domain-containing protein [Candidatus Woesearchaeota archaeon]|nr:DUF188 domain-containing protein [Candidatus Woesearchaeota archaeon]
MKSIFLDTSFLVHCAEWKLDFISEVERLIYDKYQFIIVSPVYDELALLEHSRGRTKFHAKLAHAILKTLTLQIIKSNKKSADEAIIESAEKNDLVATHDAELKRKLKKKGVECLVIRQKKYLIII